MSRYQRASLERLLVHAPASVESLSVCVLRASFADTEFAAQHDSIYYVNELRHVAEYYLGASRSRFRVRSTVVPGVVKLSHPESYYGNDELWKERMAEMLIELVAKTDERLDFSRYDAFAVIHAGPGRETDFEGDSPDQIWSGFVNPEEMAEALEDTLGSPGVPTNDSLGGRAFSIDNLIVWPEDASQDGRTFGSLGLYVYEIALRIGMIPLFDSTPGDFPDSQGIGTFDLTSYGLYNAIGFIPAFPSAFNRYLMGWVEPVTIEKDCPVRLVDINSASVSDTSLIKIPINSAEYFLVDNRVHDTNFNGKFDFGDVNGNGIPENEDTLLAAEFDFFLTETTDFREEGGRLTGSGVMVWHVDESVIRGAIDRGANPNDDASWKGVDLEEADHIQDLDRPGGLASFGSYFDSYRRGNNDRFGSDTDPSSVTNSGVSTGIELADISEAAHVMNLSVRFSPPMDFTRCEYAGNAAGLSPIPADVNGDGVEELVVAADTGVVYLAAQAGSRSWNGDIARIATIDRALWSGPPILADVDGDLELEIFISSKDATLHAFEPTGDPFTIDTDPTPGALKLRGDRASAPIAVEIDGDERPEILVLSSDVDTTYVSFIGFSGPWPGNGSPHRPIGSDGIEMRLSVGQLASHPASGVSTAGTTKTEGIFFVTTRHLSDSLRVVLSLDFLRLMENGAFIGHIGARHGCDLVTEWNGAEFLTISAGDVNRDGSDEMVAVIPSHRGLPESELAYRGWSSIEFAPLRGSRQSSPVLADIDGDGTLETAIRDDHYLYLLSGYGAPVSGWPIPLDERIVAHDTSAVGAPPVIADVNEDGHTEVVFRVAGDLHAFDFYGKEVSGWPLPGEGYLGGSPAFLKGEGGDLYLFDPGTFLPYSVDTSLGGELGAAVSSVRRYDPRSAYSAGQQWPCYRHDAGGSSRQLPSPGDSPRGTRIDPSTFIIYPNPATGPRVTIRVLISAPAEVQLKVFTVEGETAYEVKRSHQWFEGSAVPFEETMNTEGLSSGVYLCRIEVAGNGWRWNGSKKFAITR